MKTVNVTNTISAEDLLRQGQDEELLVMRDGHVVALLVPFDEDDVEWYERERDPAFIASIAQAREQVRAGNTIGHDQLKKELGL